MYFYEEPADVEAQIFFQTTGNPTSVVDQLFKHWTCGCQNASYHRKSAELLAFIIHENTNMLIMDHCTLVQHDLLHSQYKVTITLVCCCSIRLRIALRNTLASQQTQLQSGQALYQELHNFTFHPNTPHNNKTLHKI